MCLQPAHVTTAGTCLFVGFCHKVPTMYIPITALATYEEYLVKLHTYENFQIVCNFVNNLDRIFPPFTCLINYEAIMHQWNNTMDKFGLLAEMGRVCDEPVFTPFDAASHSARIASPRLAATVDADSRGPCICGHFHRINGRRYDYAFDINGTAVGVSRDDPFDKTLLRIIGELHLPRWTFMFIYASVVQGFLRLAHASTLPFFSHGGAPKCPVSTASTGFLAPFMSVSMYELFAYFPTWFRTLQQQPLAQLLANDTPAAFNCYDMAPLERQLCADVQAIVDQNAAAYAECTAPPVGSPPPMEPAEEPLQKEAPRDRAAPPEEPPGPAIVEEHPQPPPAVAPQDAVPQGASPGTAAAPPKPSEEPKQLPHSAAMESLSQSTRSHQPRSGGKIATMDSLKNLPSREQVEAWAAMCYGENAKQLDYYQKLMLYQQYLAMLPQAMAMPRPAEAQPQQAPSVGHRVGAATVVRRSSDTQRQRGGRGC